MNDSPVRISLVIPSSGPSGLFGPSCRASADVAVAELNRSGGILGRSVEFTEVDGGADAAVLAGSLRKQALEGKIDAVLGWHPSSARVALAQSVGGLVPYIYTAVYEGGEETPGVFTTGEVPEEQVIPSLYWMSREMGIRRWYVVGSDYIWPRLTYRRVLREIISRAGDFTLEGSVFVPLKTRDFSDVIADIGRTPAAGVLVLLLGQDAVSFNREFSSSGMDSEIVRLGPLMDENMLLASGTGSGKNLYSTSGFFGSLTTPSVLEYSARVASGLGSAVPPLTSPGESCHEGFTLLSKLAESAGSLNLERVSAAADKGLRYGSPRGEVMFRGKSLSQSVYIARAEGVEFGIVDMVHRPSLSFEQSL